MANSKHTFHAQHPSVYSPSLAAGNTGGYIILDYVNFQPSLFSTHPFSNSMKVRALYDFKAAENEELSFAK